MHTVTQEISIVKARTATSLLFLVMGLGYSSWAPMVPYAKVHLELNDAALGMLLLILAIGALVAMPIAGWAVERWGCAKVTIYAAPFIGLLLPLLALAPSFYVLAGLLFIFGIVDGALNVSMNAHSVVVEKLYARPILSSFHALFSLGGLLGAGFMSILLSVGVSLTSSALCAFLAISAILIYACRHLLPMRAETSEDKASNSISPSIFSNRTVIIYGVMCFSMFLAEGAMLDWGAVLLCSSHNYDLSVAGIGYACFSIAMALGRITGDRLITKFGPILVVQIGGVLSAIGLMLTLVSNPCYLELLGFLLIGFGAANIVPILFGAAGNLKNISASIALTTVITMGYAGMLLGPAAIGWIAEFSSLSVALSGVALMVLGVALSAKRI
jgi:MFS family permease